MGLFETFNFDILGDPTFKEDSVREEITHPILIELGYSASGLNRIIRSKSLIHPFVQIGSKTRFINLYPDYLLTVEGKPAWVLDAKAPGEEIKTGENVEQAYSYAIHPEIRAKVFALCNGREFIAFRTDDGSPLIYFQLSEIEKYWQEFYDLLSPQAFGTKQSLVRALRQKPIHFDYQEARLLPEITDLRKQSAKRHFGVHGYFTKQVWNVVQEYIKNFTQPGDLVLDPFGGSGVTLVETLMLGRKAIHIDINPHSIFIVKNLVAPVSLEDLHREYNRVKSAFEKNIPCSNKEISLALKKYPYPKGISLPKDSDVQSVEELFSPKQLAQLALLKSLIMETKSEDIKGTLLLMFSGLLNKINLTYHASSGRTEGRGDSAVFRYYRYRLAPKPADLDIMKYFESRLHKIISAKKEMEHLITRDTLNNAEIYKGSATDLSKISDESVDYIYTDPPYGSKIQYLDLSTMWTAWLDLKVSTRDFILEAIEGGERQKSKQDYSELLSKSIFEMFRVLKYDRWMSFVFAHKDPAYWHIIVETAERAGFEYMGAVQQSNNKVTFKKRQHPFTVLSGQLIISFRKVKNPKAIMKIDLGADITNIVLETIEGIIAQNEGATLEQINDELIIRGLELGFLDLLSKEYKDISPLLRQNFTYDSKTNKFHIPENSKFRSRIDVHLRIRYLILSYMRRMEIQKHYPTFDEIVLNIMPLLKNGITPKHQTILGVLEMIAQRVGTDRYKLSSQGQLNLELS